jgi:hypothetical protein
MRKIARGIWNPGPEWRLSLNRQSVKLFQNGDPKRPALGAARKTYECATDGPASRLLRGGLE